MQFLKSLFSLLLSPPKRPGKRKAAMERVIITSSGTIYRFGFTFESGPEE